MKKLINYTIIFSAAIIFTFLSICKNLKITNIQNELVTIDILGVEFNYYYESEE